MKRPLLLSVVSCSLAFAAAAFPLRVYAAPDLLNGSFEDPALAPNSFSSGNEGTSWTANNSNVNLVSDNYGNLGKTPYGRQYLGFTAPAASDQQTVSGFLADQSYVLTLFFADVAGSANPQLTVTISGAANATGTFTAPVSDASGGQYPFQQADVPFTTFADGAVTVALMDSGSADVAVDNVSLASVPEASPAFAMILLATTMAVGFCSRSAKGRVNDHRSEV
jgi:hypothetical protein